MAIVLYARKSVERENSISCETQLEYCRMTIKPEERDETIVTYVDNGFSGGNVDRDGFQQLMKLVRQDKVSKVIVYKLDRISRSLSDFVNILQEFKAHKVEFVSSQESFDTSSPYGELIVKILMVFAEFERASTIDRVTQAYAHRSEMGFYMGGRRPYGFELAPTVIHGIKTKKLEPVPLEAEQVRYIFEVYAQEDVSLRRLLDILEAEGKRPLNGSEWSTSKLSAMLKNPLYVKADLDVYDYYDRRGVRIMTDASSFTGEHGAQLYGRTKHRPGDPDGSDMKLVLLTHSGIVDPGIWLECQRKLEQNRKLTNSYSSAASWLAGKVVCEECGCTMTTVKGKRSRAGEVRRYFNCTGRSHKKICTGPKVTIYAEDLEDMVDDCIAGKLSDLERPQRAVKRGDTAEIDGLKLKLKAIERSERQLIDTMLEGGLGGDLLELANQKAARFKKDRQALCARIEELKGRGAEPSAAADLAKAWRSADYRRKKAAAMIAVHRIVVSEDGSIKVIWAL